MTAAGRPVGVVAPGAILASSTSSLSPAALAAGLTHPESQDKHDRMTAFLNRPRR